MDPSCGSSQNLYNEVARCQDGSTVWLVYVINFLVLMNNNHPVTALKIFVNQEVLMT